MGNWGGSKVFVLCMFVLSWRPEVFGMTTQEGAHIKRRLDQVTAIIEQAILRVRSNRERLTSFSQTGLPTIAPEPGCRISGYVSINGVCYKHFSERKTYDEARRRCAEDGGLLAMPKDSAMNRFLAILGGVDTWIGLTDAQTEGQWVYADGQTTGYTNWNTGEPNNSGDGGEDCALFWNSLGVWNDFSCSDTKKFICQIDQGCPISDYISVNGVCYKQFSDRKTYDEARQRCAADGALLAMPKDSATNRFLASLCADCWFGMTDSITEGRWVYADGQLASFTNWNGGEPNNAGDGGEDCATYANLGGAWNDFRCSGTTGFICQIEQGCPISDYISVNGVCYKQFSEQKTYDEARRRCAADGGLLATPKDSATNTFLVSFGAGGGNPWLGVTDALTEGQWVGADGHTISYTNWNGGEPNNAGNEDCVLFAHSGGVWNDMSCSFASTFICQIEQECPISGYISVDGACYKHFSERKTYDEARQRCAADGSLLAVPKDSAGNRFLASQRDGYCWIGLTDAQTEGQWVGADGQPAGYTNWDAREPNNAGNDEDCAMFSAHPAGAWNDRNCGGTFEFICQIDQGCPISDYVRFNGVCYKQFSEVKTYDKARQRCAVDGGRLATPEDSATNTFFARMKSGYYWIGLTDAETEGQWVGADGQPPRYTNWNEGEPNDNGNGEDCALILSSGVWNDFSCSETNGFICQIDQD